MVHKEYKNIFSKNQKYAERTITQLCEEMALRIVIIKTGLKIA
jgi:hypothetical protein